MSQLRVIWPERDSASLDAVHSVAPATIPFYAAVRSRRRPVMDVLTRAQVLFANRTCHACGYPVVEPIELEDAVINRNGLPIPGTATLVGFHCQGCDEEWSA